MAINFPNSPSVNDTYTANDKTWIWNGTAWANQPALGYVKATFTATAGQTTFNTTYDIGFVDVFCCFSFSNIDCL